jgi:hypothetical protein
MSNTCESCCYCSPFKDDYNNINNTSDNLVRNYFGVCTILTNQIIPIAINSDSIKESYSEFIAVKSEFCCNKHIQK